jgi:N-acetylglucosaminyldiphosphoundecaprenol N-acetyl-beta-D-mannosaminyltransferase
LSGQPTNSSSEEIKIINLKLKYTHATSITLLGVHIHDLSKSEIVTSVMRTVIAGEQAIFVYVNIYAINLAQTLPWFRNFLNNAACAYCDGFGVLLGSRFAGSPLTYRSTPPDWIADLAYQCASRALTIFLLGGRPGVAERAAVALIQQNPGLRISGVHHGYFDTTQASIDNQGIIRAINELSPDILLVGMGMPLQEKWLDENVQHLKVKVALPVGALLDYMADEKRRPPRWMTNNGLEWAGRLFLEPRRLWRRYLLGIPYFYYLILSHRLGAGR